MKIKVGNKEYDGVNEPIMVILSEQDKYNISQMPETNYRYAQQPIKMDDKEMSKWMDDCGKEDRSMDEMTDYANYK